jgi:hypothetical protein
LILAALLAVSCVPAVPLSRDEAARLSTAPSIPVLHVRPAPPWVDCPNGEGQKVWDHPGIWESIQDQWTRSLRTPPVDPAKATAAHLLSLARPTHLRLPLAERTEEVQRADVAVLLDRFGDLPVLVVEAVRWVLVGCFFTYQPWFEVRATLFRPSTGEVLWRDTCGGTYPGGSPVPASRDELEANGRWLYTRIIEERAAACSTQLAASLTGAAPP